MSNACPKCGFNSDTLDFSSCPKCGIVISKYNGIKYNSGTDKIINNTIIEDTRWKCSFCGISNANSKDKCGGCGQYKVKTEAYKVNRETKTWTCPNCNEIIDDSFQECSKCEGRKWQCSCGIKNKGTLQACVGCGWTKPIDYLTTDKNRINENNNIHVSNNFSLVQNINKHIKDILKNKRIILSIIAVFFIIATATHLFSNKNSSQRMAKGLINEWVIGNDGEEYWSSLAEKKVRLFNVKSYQYVSSEYLPKAENIYSNISKLRIERTLWNIYLHKFRIQSTTKGGFPIEILWNIYVADTESGWKVIGIDESN